MTDTMVSPSTLLHRSLRSRLGSKLPGHFDSARMLTHGGSVDTEPPRVSVRADVGIHKITV
jgi:hypothetical protein